jgi:DNA-binding response OmpR family regulator
MLQAFAMTSQPPPDATIPRTQAMHAVLIEDDERLARLTKRYLEGHDVVVDWFADGRTGLEQVLRIRPDIVLLDLQLPQLDGVAVCRELRSRSDVPILMITARVEEADRVLGLELGADDYIPKPFSSRELLARMRAQVRRARGQVGPEPSAIAVGGLSLDPSSLQAMLDGKPLSLTSHEFMLLRALAERAGRVLSREQLLYALRGNAEDTFDRSIDVQISRLRQKLGDDSRNPRLLKTVRGVGYMLALEH